MELRHSQDQRFHYEDVIRSYPLAGTATKLVETGPDSDEERGAVPGTDGVKAEPGRSLAGFPVVFDRWTEIQSWDGPFLERVVAGSADETLAKRSDKIQLMFNHGFDMTLEQTPIGRHTLFDARSEGVWNEAALVDRGVYPKIDLLAELIRMGAVYGQSFRFSVLAEEWRDDPDPSDHNPKGIPERSITEFRWYESGPVTYPAYEATSVSLRDGVPFAVRSASEWQLWCEARHQPATLTETVQQVSSSRLASIARVTRSSTVDELSAFMATLTAGR